MSLARRRVREGETRREIRALSWLLPQGLRPALIFGIGEPALHAGTPERMTNNIKIENACCIFG
jgi:hypothetical protein